MIRPATTGDKAEVIDLAVAAGMFSADEAWLVEGMLEDYFGGKTDEGHGLLDRRRGRSGGSRVLPAQDRRR